jgi:hypothetical protein
MLKIRILQKFLQVLYPHLSTSTNRVYVDYDTIALKPFIHKLLHGKNRQIFREVKMVLESLPIHLILAKTI